LGFIGARMMEVVVRTGTIRCAVKLSPPTNHQCSGGARVFCHLGQRSVLPPLQLAILILSALNKLKININLR